jgi:hypothetical protein
VFEQQIILSKKQLWPNIFLASMTYHLSPEVVLVNAAGPVQPGVSCQGRAGASVSCVGHEADAGHAQVGPTVGAPLHAQGDKDVGHGGLGAVERLTNQNLSCFVGQMTLNQFKKWLYWRNIILRLFFCFKWAF